MSPRFTVLLPTRHRPATLRLAIRSVLQQTAQDFELLVVGDGCSDDTRAVVKSVTDPRVRWYDLPKAPGFGYANRNVALADARGAYLAFVGDDDLLLPDHLDRMSAALETSKAEWAYSRPLWITTDGLVVPFPSNLLNADELETYLTEANHIPACCVMYRRECLEQYGGWPETVPQGGDWKYWIRIIEGGGRGRMGLTPVPTTLHFTADWKTAPNQQMPQVIEARAIACSPWRWPDGLRVQIPAGMSEQQTFFDLLNQPGWVDALRADVVRVVDRLAWLHLDAHSRTQDIVYLSSALASVTSERDVMLGSLSWRLSAPIRRLSGLLRGRRQRQPLGDKP